MLKEDSVYSLYSDIAIIDNYLLGINVLIKKKGS